MQCPRCGSSAIVKNGSNANGKKKFLCKDCSRQFVENPQNRRISDAEWRIVDKLLLEKISMAGIARAVSISKRWLQEYVKKNGIMSRERLSACRKAGQTHDFQSPANILPRNELSHPALSLLPFMPSSIFSCLRRLSAI